MWRPHGACGKLGQGASQGGNSPGPAQQAEPGGFQPPPAPPCVLARGVTRTPARGSPATREEGGGSDSFSASFHVSTHPVHRACCQVLYLDRMLAGVCTGGLLFERTLGM